MKAIIPIKRVPDPYMPVRLAPDGRDIVLENIPHAINPFDEVALTKAVELRQQGQISEILAVSIGTVKTNDILRTALAMGADRALHLITSRDQILEPFHIASILAEIIKDEQADLVLMGKQAVDQDAGQTPALLAGFLDWPYLPDIYALNLERDKATCKYELHGYDTTARASTPFVASCDLHLAEPRPISLPQMMKAKQKQIIDLDLEHFLTDHELKLKSASARTSLCEPSARPPCRLFTDVKSLADQLKTDGVLP